MLSALPQRTSLLKETKIRSSPIDLLDQEWEFCRWERGVRRKREIAAVTIRDSFFGSERRRRWRSRWRWRWPCQFGSCCCCGRYRSFKVSAWPPNRECGGGRKREGRRESVCFKDLISSHFIGRLVGGCHNGISSLHFASLTLHLEQARTRPSTLRGPRPT